MKKVNLVLVGFGVVCRGLAEVLLDKKSYLQSKLGLDFSVVAVCEKDGSLVNEGGVNLRKALAAKRLSKHPDWVRKSTFQVIDSVEADVVVELTPGNVKSGQPGMGHIKKALDRGLHVVTSNKAPLALKYRELMKLARKNGVSLKYEAAVAGAIPLLNLYEHALRVNEIKSIYGILNGTTNYVLSKMAEEGVDLGTALKEAQELGIAEPDAGYDLDGVDSAVKVVILANALMGRRAEFRDVKVTGIRDVTSDTVELAKKHGYVVKLIGDVSNLVVSPRLVPLNHPLNVNDSLNAVLLETDVAGDLTLIGRGAGPRETASSLISDLIEVAKVL